MCTSFPPTCSVLCTCSVLGLTSSYTSTPVPLSGSDQVRSTAKRPQGPCSCSPASSSLLPLVDKGLLGTMDRAFWGDGAAGGSRRSCPVWVPARCTRRPGHRKLRVAGSGNAAIADTKTSHHQRPSHDTARSPNGSAPKHTGACRKHACLPLWPCQQAPNHCLPALCWRPSQPVPVLQAHTCKACALPLTSAQVASPPACRLAAQWVVLRDLAGAEASSTQHIRLTLRDQGAMLSLLLKRVRPRSSQTLEEHG